ncbi:carbohydrate kinase [Rhizobiaceae bacterium BDR2-2]|uniref:Carbohydrate kinase n=1 Tax=Ectorhizobium quercum TaxID=2965071 RepID=A0AAE3MZF7_9HYPH|nr:carbohydrate kinase [Ectorhizobium quercum]MCX8997197.1 carbohydrate kinase [Ectorhizobium quercum]
MILCCGEALIDMIPMPTVSGADGFVPHTGGAVFNTAIALGRLGVDAGMVTGLSTDLFGRKLAEALRASHVDTSRVILSDRPTTMAFVHLVDGQATYTFYDENSAGRMILPEDLPPVSGEAAALYFGGISLAVEPGAETYAALLARDGASRTVMLDPNIRPGFIKDIALYRDRLWRMLAATDIVKVSDDDLAWLFPGGDPLRVKAGQLRLAGAAIVIVTHGDEGATAYFGEDAEVSVPALKVAVVDTVGAGDTFNAGVLASLDRQGRLSKSAVAALTAEPLTEALTFGAKVAAATVSRAGANPPWAHEF